MTSDEHKEFINRLSTVADEGGKSISQKVLRAIDFDILVRDRKRQRKRVLKEILKGADQLFTDASKLGHEFAEKKLNDS